ncbi:hypothetical protein M3Y95_01205600 [Aphelenchoides besseyi]|nr:hypothetical protein M3Y95_01205600 [Aphelenchoides besseyi]
MDFLVCFLLIFLEIVDSYGNNQCIQPYEYHKNNYRKRGFVFKNCNHSAEITIKWKTEHELSSDIWSTTIEERRFKLVVNDDCELDFEGRGVKGAKWTSKEDSVTFECTETTMCDLSFLGHNQLLIRGNLYACNEKVVNNKIDDQWLWTQIRVIDFAAEYTFRVYVWDYDEGEEYIPQIVKSIGTTSDVK